MIPTRTARILPVMFTPEARERLRAELIDVARSDPNVTAAATTGSAAVGALDAWSDIDLALRVTDESLAVREWTDRMYTAYNAVHHLDVFSGRTRFRVFLIADTLQVDIAFWAPEDFGATSPAFDLMFGAANEKPRTPPPEPAELVGYAWLYALHARSSIARGRAWQAEYMISQARDSVLALACLGRGLPWREGRGMDQLPADVLALVTPALVRSLDADELRRAFEALVDALRAETAASDVALEQRIGPTLAALVTSPHRRGGQ
jgi:hypothetical protein